MYTSAQQPQSQGSVEDPFHSLSGLSPAAPAPAQPADASPAGHGVEGGAREFMKLQASLERTLRVHNEDILRVLEAVTARLERVEGAVERLEASSASLKASVDSALSQTLAKACSCEGVLVQAASNVQALRDKQTLLEETQRLSDVTLSEAKAELLRVKDVAKEAALEAVRQVRQQQAEDHAAAAAAAAVETEAAAAAAAAVPIEPAAAVPEPAAPAYAPSHSYVMPPAPSFGGFPGFPPGSPPPMHPPPMGYPQYAPPQPPPPIGYPSPPPHGDLHSHGPPPLPQMLLSPPPPAMESYGYGSAPPPPPPQRSHDHGGYGYPSPPPPPPPPMRGAPAMTTGVAKVPIDKVIEDVSNMGFSRDEVRAVIRSLTDNGQTVDLNQVIDRLMNGPGSSAVAPEAAARGRAWFGR